ncbi:MAG: LLM class F420-dependent oxidoreductase [Armatimonadetes bacterium]|nr:LLM class F420-dependent oxidoreductase [Armatimonadota bacterium]
MKIGLQIPNLTFQGGPGRLGPTLARIARRADQAGLSSLWVMDHFFQIEYIGPAEMDMLEGYTTLGFLAAHTERIRLGTLVTGVTYRHPGILIKTVTTLDVLCGGRAWFGVGAAWFEREHRGLGVAYPPASERFERLEETLELGLKMWSDDNGPYRGKHYRLEETLCVPPPLSRPHPPIMIGGMGERKTLQLVARYAQACNLFEFAGPAVLRQKLAILREHCRAQGRNYDEIEKTTLGSFNVSRDGAANTRTPDRFLKDLRALGELGIGHAIYSLPRVEEPEQLELFLELAERASQVEVGRR